MSKRNHNAVRTCLGCAERDLKRAMVRVALVGGVATVDAAQRHAGRGGYLHRSLPCLERFERHRLKPFRSLKSPVGMAERRRITETIKAGWLGTVRGDKIIVNGA
ncbi:MAG TPA: YlxR family protein [Candidatus Binataceae bacterium]|jgi:predicted RNA-binding protein YlxR (DUF448 family)|nr:YlxR family protein [Candidatus Binataceae bacterium]